MCRIINKNNLKVKSSSIPSNDMGFFRKIKEVIVNPKGFFDAIQSETDIKHAVIYYLILQLIIFPIGLIPFVIFNPGSFIISSVLFLSFWLVGMFFFFLVMLVYHLIVKWMGGVSGYERTFQALIYGTTPGLLLGWFPIVNLFAGAYSIYISIIGFMKLQQMPRNKAIWAYFLPFIAVVLLMTLLGLFLGFARAIFS